MSRCHTLFSAMTAAADAAAAAAAASDVENANHMQGARRRPSLSLSASDTSTHAQPTACTVKWMYMPCCAVLNRRVSTVHCSFPLSLLSPSPVIIGYL